MAETSTRRERRRKLSIEQYIDFLRNRDDDNLTHEQLNQIIDMHGFKKRHKDCKKKLAEALSKVELMELQRSTTQNDHVSSCAHLSLEEAIKALDDLEWQECHVSSLVTVNAYAVDDSTAAPKKPQQKKGKKNNNKAAKGMGEGNDLSTSNPRKEIASKRTTVVAKGTPPSAASVDTCASLIGGKAQLKKKKRKEMGKSSDSAALKPRNAISKKGTTVAAKGTSSSFLGGVDTCATVIGGGEKKPPRVKKGPFNIVDGAGVSTS